MITRWIKTGLISFIFYLVASPLLGQGLYKKETTLKKLHEQVLKSFGNHKIKTRTKLRIMRYEDIDGHLAAILSWFKEAADDMSFDGAPGENELTLRFSQIFRPSKENSYFPLTNNIVRQVPEASLQGLNVYDKTGCLLGIFSNKYTFTRRGVRSYTLYYFQYQIPDGSLRQSGTDLLLDRFLVKWDDLKDHPLLILTPAR